MNRIWRRIGRGARNGSAAVLLGVLAACASPGHIGGSEPAFDRVGRFAVNLQPVAQAPYAAQGGFSWRDDGRTLQLDLTSPLGSILARIRVMPRRSILERADGQRDVAATPDALLAQVWGHSMPVAGLRDWIRGELSPGMPTRAVQRDDAGRLIAFEQSDWQVRLSQYDDIGPRRIRLDRHDGEGRWRLQLIVTQD